MAVHSVATTTSETTLNWNNKPAAGATALSTQTIINNTPRWYKWDVTAFVQAEKTAGRNTISFVVKAPANSSPHATFNSREATGSSGPQLVAR